MTETAVILNTATPRSFIVLDEIGRGTATYDGLALAWAVVEHIHARTRAKTLFATHYHELTELAEQLEGVRNLQRLGEGSGRPHHLPAQSRAGQGRPQLRHRSGAPGGPAAERDRARPRSAEAARAHRARGHAKSWRKPEETGPVQIRLFEPVGYGIAERIRGLNLDELRPIEALQLLAELQKELKRA